ncbi:CHAT domain-containing protein [Stigmatella erecta]|uniref:Putative zinc-finger n=1 Tax=Stigmatella erecta TaxID=83460 RepID=A0A1I0KSV8_9BACT|nr:CHAT domain-containing protein [Stigmatella erecta]SEU27992.1 Putative zinc-finger [Stigmatella erecta]
MHSACDNIEPFVDGELPAEEAEAFRQHLPDCARCQREFADILQLELLGKRHHQRAAMREAGAPPTAPPPWRHPLTLGASLLTMAVVAVLAVRALFPNAPPQDVWLAHRPQRPLRVRLNLPEADRHRPPAAKPMAQGSRPEELPLEALSKLQNAQDFEGLASAYLLHGVPELAQEPLEKLGRTPNTESLRAATLLVQDEPAKALRHTATALETEPHHPQALWNRGLALERLDLLLLAARTFEDVAALKEPGWSTEALGLATDLRRLASERRARWDQVFQAGKTLIESGPTDLPEDFAQAPLARLFFYDAVRAAPDADHVRALLPLAAALDARTGDPILETYVRRTAQADFTKRGPLARAYANLALGRLSTEQKERLLTELLSSPEDDLLLGAIVHTQTVARHQRLFEDKALAQKDPWFMLLSAEKGAAVDQASGHFGRATQTLLDALRHCPSPGLEYRCLFLQRELSGLYIQRGRLEEARQLAEEGWRSALELNEWFLQRDFLWNLAQVARYTNDAPIARARYEELLERSRGDLEMVRRAHQNFAEIALHKLQADEARREMDAALDTGLPLSFSGAFALADLSRLRPGTHDGQHLERALDTAWPRLTPGERIIATHIRGRFYIEREPPRGQELLWTAIHGAEAQSLAEDPGAQRARTYSFTSLIFDAGRRQAFDEALKLFAQERSQELPRQCLLAAAVDSERTLLIARGANGEQLSHHGEERREPLSERLDGLVPPRLLGALRGCAQVHVLARPPLHGRAGMLPPEFAWSYLTRTSAPRTPPPGPARHLVVSEVKLPLAHERSGPLLTNLNPWLPSFGPNEIRTTLKGAEATPSRVLEAMKNKTEIDLVAHGVINDSSDDSYLQLAQGESGSRLGVQQVREASLQGAPFVVLAACHAASTAYVLQEPLSLPAAFIQSGARGVLAATTQLWDLDAGDFFNEVRASMRQGVPPAIALRDARGRWLKEGKNREWLTSILLFE